MDSSTPSSSGLGSLAQSARGKQLKQARGILLAIGILTIVVNAIFMGFARQQVRKELDAEVAKAGGPARVDAAKVKEIEENAVRFVYLVDGAAIALGIVFVIFAVVIRQYPVPVTVTSLVLYIGATVVFGLLDPHTLVQGIIIKIIMVVGLVKAIQAAVAYQKEQTALLSAETPGL